LNCSFKLKSAQTPALESFGEMTFRLFDQWKRPLLRVLHGRGTYRPSKAPCVRGALLRNAAESQQALDLGFARHQLQKHPRKPDRFFGQIADTADSVELSLRNWRVGWLSKITW